MVAQRLQKKCPTTQRPAVVQTSDKVGQVINHPHEEHDIEDT